jgi:diacylglycerol kinase family enzyme
VNGRRFAFAAGIGVDSETVRELETVQRARAGRRPGDLAYARMVAARLLRGYSPRLDVRGVGGASILLVSNDRVFTYAGPRPLVLSRWARFELGLDFVAPERVDAKALSRFVPRLAVGRGLAGARGVLAGHDLDGFEVACDEPLPLQADGEDLGDVREAIFESERDALTVLVRG